VGPSTAASRAGVIEDQRLTRGSVVAGAQSLALGHADQDRQDPADAILLDGKSLLKAPKPCPEGAEPRFERSEADFKIGNLELQVVHMIG
jgi:hypothetical protein